jgi:hypothetical protein
LLHQNIASILGYSSHQHCFVERQKLEDPSKVLRPEKGNLLPYKVLIHQSIYLSKPIYPWTCIISSMHDTKENYLSILAPNGLNVMKNNQLELKSPPSLSSGFQNAKARYPFIL